MEPGIHALSSLSSSFPSTVLFYIKIFFLITVLKCVLAFYVLYLSPLKDRLDRILTLKYFAGLLALSWTLFLVVISLLVNADSSSTTNSNIFLFPPSERHQY